MSKDRVIDLPQVFPLRQKFKRTRVENIDALVEARLSHILGSIRITGKKIGVTATSRGIANQPEILRAICNGLRARGAQPYLVPAMGSHGGGTAEGEIAKLAEVGIGVTSATVGAEILSGMETVLVDTVEGLDVHCSKIVLEELDGVILFCRIKEHTDIVWDDGSAKAARLSFYHPVIAGREGKYWGIESGLSKVLAIGLAKMHASKLHHYRGGLGPAVEIAARRLLEDDRVNVLGGIGVIDNAYDETAEIVSIPWTLPDKWFKAERKILDRSKNYLPALPFPEAYYDLLYVHRAGKSISGQGVHTKTVGRGYDIYERGFAWGPGMPAIDTIVCSTLVGSNANGCGKFQYVTERYWDAVDWEITDTNARTTGYWASVARPQVLKTDRDLIEVGLANGTCGRSGPRIAFIVSTEWMENVWLSEAFLSAAKRLPPSRAEIVGPLQRIPFDEEGFIRLPSLRGLEGGFKS